ncbi:Adhesion G-protein coupled receptor D1 [Acropora cervicornis]|uniref:Adhesion G-protein coupled receptor D1 n=1 Tax=Acropora cervicornis TaxID=6130 RepID=A0AAD9V453_ACRCE|nr:Adhesion G-protein coupled receptor D1 [Acropora cervicornis]
MAVYWKFLNMVQVTGNFSVHSRILFWVIVLVLTRICRSLYPYPVWGSPYESADHFWPMYNITDGILEDVEGAAHTMVYNGGKIAQVPQLEHALFLDGVDDYVDTGGFNADCVTEPSRCSEGFTLAFWLKVNGTGYIMSSGSFTNHRNGPGYQLYYHESLKRFKFLLETRDSRWSLLLHEEVGLWTHMTFTWNNRDGLRYYEDGNLSTFTNRPVSVSPLRRQNYTPVITLARPSNMRRLGEYGKFEISKFAIWLKELSTEEIAGVYRKMNCVSNPCHDSEQCQRKSQSQGKTCICPEVNLRRETCKEKITGECEDKSTGCREFAAQSHYCKHRKMRKICPRSCSYCGKSCEVLLCKNYAQCIATDEGHAQCRCPQNCSAGRRPVCGTNGKSYLNILHCPWFFFYFLRLFPAKTERFPGAEGWYKKLVDMRGNASAKAFNGVQALETEQLAAVLKMDGKDDFIEIEGFDNNCVVNPTMCTEGLSEFIISGGDYTKGDHGPGFRFICENCGQKKHPHAHKTQRFLLELSTEEAKWKILLESIPSWWFHFAFTWNGNKGLKFYENGKLALSNNFPVSVERRSTDPKNTIMTIGRANSITGLVQPKFGNFSIGHLVIWTYALSSFDVEVAFMLVQDKTAKSIKCCSQMKADPCIKNPCHNGATCHRIEDKYRCICPDASRPSHCSLEHKLPQPCRDKSPQCLEFARQTGYCDYRKKRMRALCPEACNFCGLVKSRVSALSTLSTDNIESREKFLTTATSIFYTRVKTASSFSFSTSVQSLSTNSVPSQDESVIACKVKNTTCLCYNCEGAHINVAICCMDLIDIQHLQHGVIMNMTDITVWGFYQKLKVVSSVIAEEVMKSCQENPSLCVNAKSGVDISGKRKKRSLRELKFKNNILFERVRFKREALRRDENPAMSNVSHLDVIIYNISSRIGQPSNVETTFFISMMSSSDGNNQTGAVDGKGLLEILRNKKRTLENKLNISIDSFAASKKGNNTPAIPNTSMLNSSGAGNSNMTPQSSGEGNFDPHRLCWRCRIDSFVDCTDIRDHTLRQRKGEFLPDKIHGNWHDKENGDASMEDVQNLPSIIDPSTPRITDVPHKPTRSQATGRGGGRGAKKAQKPMGVQESYLHGLIEGYEAKLKKVEKKTEWCSNGERLKDAL